MIKIRDLYKALYNSVITQFLRDSFFKKALKAKSDILRDFHNKALKKLSDIRKERLFIFQEKLNYFFAATEAHMFQPQVKVNDM